MTVAFALPRFQASDINGAPLASGKLFTYQTGSSTPATTYQDQGGTIPNLNPIILDSLGEAVVWLDPATIYRFDLQTSDNVPVWTQDDVTGIVSSVDFSVFETDLANATNASLVGFIQEGTGAVLRSQLAKTREISVSNRDFDSGQTDQAIPIQNGFDVIKSRNGLVIDGTQLRYGARTLELEPGVYDFSTTLVLDADAKLVAKGPPGSVILRYSGTGTAIVINSTQLTLSGAPENTRSFYMENIALVAESASEGIRIGANTNTNITLTGCEIFGVQGPAINCGAAVYFLALHNCRIRFCTQPTYVGEYCDLLTIDDRSNFTSNPNGALLLECPTFLITNCDFELNGGLADIQIRNSPNIANNRNGLIFKNRFGPEVTVGNMPVNYDIALIENSGLPPGSALSDMRIWCNEHFTGGSFPAKVSPILLNARTRRLDIRSEKFSGYSSTNFIATTDLTTALGVGTTWDSITDKRSLVQNELQGIFSGDADPDRRVVITATTVTAFVAVYSTSYKSLTAGSGLGVATLVASTSQTNYSKLVGFSTYAMTANLPMVIGVDGAVIVTNIDTTGSSYWAPLYLQADGTLGLIAPATASALRVARVLTVGASATVLIDLQAVA